MAGAIVCSLVKNLASLYVGENTVQEVTQGLGVEEAVRELESNLSAIEAVLEDAERRQVKEASVKQWLNKLEDVCYDLDDVLDEWNTAILKKQIEGDENAPTKKRKFSSMLANLFSSQVGHHHIAVKIKELNKRLDVIANEKRNFNFTSMGGKEEPRQKYGSVIDVSKVHGRDQDKSTIVDKLLSEGSQAPALRIISIVGMGGIGKTTLAQLVYNDKKVQAHFQNNTIWVCVSDPFDECRIAKVILETLKCKAPEVNEFETLLQEIHQCIEGKKFLLVLDDVWTEDYRKFEQLNYSLHCGSPGSRILMTTRKEAVAKTIGTTDDDMLRLGQLSDEEGWSLFSQVAFFGRKSEERKKLEDIGRGIADKCKGLPLAIKILGSLLRFKDTKEEWQNVLDSELWELEAAEKGIFPPLLLSYYDLSSRVKWCLLYCSIFPKDYKMKKDELIKLWMAQGFLGTIHNRDMEMMGEECFKNLVMHSFFQDVIKEVDDDDDDDNGIITCKMHDIVHDSVQSLTKNEYILMELNGHEKSRLDFPPVEARHLMVLDGSVSFPTPVNNFKKLRSLITEGFQMTSALLSEVLDQLTYLRTLSLSGSWLSEDLLTELPKEVGKLIHLRYLNLSDNGKLKELPEEVCDLCNLQTLNVRCCGDLKKLPHGLGKLINLRHLEISGTGLSFIPKGVERLTCLRTLNTFYVSSGVNDNEASTLGDLKNLNHLRGRLLITGLEKVRDVDEVKKAQLKNKKHLLDLILDFSKKEEEGEEEEAEGRMINDGKVIEAIQPPPNLEDLRIYGYQGRSEFLNWMMSLTYLKKVTIFRSPNCEVLLPFGKLPSLESLFIEGMDGVNRVGIEFLGIETEVNNEGASKKDEAKASSSSVIAFPKLESLCFGNMWGWEEWDYGMTRRMGEEVEEEDGTTASTITIMPRLRTLTISDCPYLKALPDHLLHSTSLETLEIFFSLIIEERYYEKRKGEDWPKISHIPNIKINREIVQKDGRLMSSVEEPTDDSEPELDDEAEVTSNSPTEL